MSSYSIPWPICVTKALPIDEGTTCITRSTPPGPICSTKLYQKEIKPEWQSQSHIKGFLPKILALSPDGLTLLKNIETLRLRPYDDQTGKEITQWIKGATIGYGHLIINKDWKTYKDGITKPQAETLFADDLTPYQEAVRNNITASIQQYQFDALVIFAFNIGIPNFKASSVVKIINNPTTKTGYDSLQLAWKAWSKSQGKENKGLMNRRNCEWNIYNFGIYKQW